MKQSELLYLIALTLNQIGKLQSEMLRQQGAIGFSDFMRPFDANLMVLFQNPPETDLFKVNMKKEPKL